MWSAYRTKPKCLPPDVSSCRQQLYSGFACALAVGVLFMASYSCMKSLSLLETVDDLESTTVQIKSWLPNATKYIDQAMVEYRTAISEYSEVLRFSDQELGLDVQLNLTTSMNELVKLNTQLLLVESPTISSIILDYANEVDRFVPFILAVAALSASVTITSTANSLIRHCCYPTEAMKVKKRTGKFMMITFLVQGVLFILLMGAGVVLQHMLVIGTADFCYDFEGSMSKEIYYRSQKTRFGSDGNAQQEASGTSDIYVQYFLTCQETRAISPFVASFNHLHGNLSSAEYSLDLIGQNTTNFAPLELMAISLCNDSISSIRGFIGDIPRYSGIPVYDLGKAISCVPLSNYIKEIEQQMCDNVLNELSTILLLAGISTVLVTVGFLLSLRVPVMDANVHAVPDPTFNSVGQTVGNPLGLMNPGFILSERKVQAGFFAGSSVHNLKGTGLDAELRPMTRPGSDTLFQPAIVDDRSIDETRSNNPQ